MRRIQGYIPRNLGGGTFLDGRVKVRNAVEAMIAGVIIYVMTKLMELFLPYIAVIVVRLVLWGLICGLCLTGINGEPVSLFFLNILNYSRSRTYVTLRPPQREISDEESREKKDPREKAMAKKSLKERIFAKERENHDGK